MYLSVTGDTAGVVVSGGNVVANCPDGKVWLAPACRSDVTKCIAYFTKDAGLGVAITLQKASKWNIPLAVSVGATESDWATLPTQFKSMFYWSLDYILVS